MKRREKGGDLDLEEMFSKGLVAVRPIGVVVTWEEKRPRNDPSRRGSFHMPIPPAIQRLYEPLA